MRAAEEAGIVTVLVTELPSAFQRLSLMVGKRPRVRMALGCHPLRAEQMTGTEKALFLQLVNKTGSSGEIGLDGSQHGKATLPAQRRILDFVLGVPEVRRKVLTVHSRGAEKETIERLAGADVTAILHWYTGALKHIPAALDAGLWFSVNPAMLCSTKGQQTIAAIPEGTDRHRDRRVRSRRSPADRAHRPTSRISSGTSLAPGVRIPSRHRIGSSTRWLISRSPPAPSPQRPTSERVLTSYGPAALSLGPLPLPLSWHLSSAAPRRQSFASACLEHSQQCAGFAHSDTVSG